MVVIPNHFTLFNIDHVRDVFMPFLPSHFVHAHILRGRDGIQFLQRLRFQVLSVYPVNDLVIQAQIPAGFLVGGDGRQAGELIGKPLGKPATDPIEFLDPNTTVLHTNDFSLRHVKEHPLPSQAQIFHDHLPGLVNSIEGIGAATTGTDRQGLLNGFQQENGDWFGRFGSDG